MAQRLLFISILLIGYSSIFAQESDSILLNPFRKGRWYTGLSGSISSSTNNSNASKTASNDFNFNISSGKFIQDQWLLGIRFLAMRDQRIGSITKSDSEILYIGPTGSYYFQKSSNGSLLINASIGFVKFREESSILDQTDIVTNAENKGQGIGGIFGLGYSYTMFDRISFDIGFSIDSFWVDGEQTVAGTKSNGDTRIGDISFSFGFNVLLDKFFF
ncbi:outer membrane beta-barrel protein [Reichenbachiella versicolor]|uniref:outer membrane beta-barrel protein n=1 Tax=Reichenbachiella versicolor TaxID=1821036 RepID=UPI000D6E8662|nr:outer membrane beta-barrel protein [Reichenbachiella versicolor]